jgi:hypothetical protein
LAKNTIRHRCRNTHCKCKLPEPAENEHHAFCTPGCHSSFYRSRCLVCEEPMRRKNDSQKLGSGHKVCAAEYRRFPHAYDYPQIAKTAPPTGNVNEGGRSAHSTGIKSAISGELAVVRGWRWEAEKDWEEQRLVNRDGKVVGWLWPVGSRWYLLDPVSIPRQSAPDLESARRLAISMALGNLPLDREPVHGKAPWPPLNLQIGQHRSSFTITVSKAVGDPGPIPDFLRRDWSDGLDAAA